MSFWRDYLKIFVPLVILFAGYHMLVVPWIEPKQKSSVAKWSLHSPTKARQIDWWEEYFEPDSWQRNAPLVIEREQCILLYKNREQLSDTRWKLKPLTIVIPQKGNDGKKHAIFVRNPEGAEIQFKTAFDWTAGQPPPIVSGMMLGAINIYSPPDPATNRTALSIDTSDMRIDKRKIWTVNAIKMKIGNSNIDGRDLSIFMDQDILASNTTGPTAGNSPFAGLDSLELFYVDRVDVELKNGGLWPSKEVQDVESRKALAKLRCRGSFKFQFHQSQAILKNDVRMEHCVDGLPIDTFNCDELMLNVGWSENPTLSLNTASSTSMGKWRIDRLEATGAPGRDANDRSRWIKLSAPGMHAEAHGQHLIMDTTTGMITLSNTLPKTAPRSLPQVFLRRESIRIFSPQVQYQNPQLFDGSSDKKIQRLGNVLASGAGIAQLDSEHESWKLTWGKSLSVRPQDDKDLVIVDGGANINSPTRGRFVAEELHLWISPVTEELAARLSSHYPDGKVPQFVPEHIQATGEVIVDSPELRAEVETMNVRFAYPDARPSAARATLTSSANGSNGSNLSLSPSAPRLSPPNHPTTQPPSPALPGTLPAFSASPNTIPSAMPTQPSAPSSVPSPLVVNGKSLVAQVNRIGNESNIDYLALDGNFTMTREHVSETSPWPLVVTGRQLILKSESQEVSNIHLIGEPAKVAVGNGWITAPELQLSQSEQMFWIDHPGELVIPMEAMQQTQTTKGAMFDNAPALLGTNRRNANDFTGQIIWQVPPRVRWAERMTFDGRVARFGGGVTMNGTMQSGVDTLWHLMANAEQLTIEMTNPVPLQFQKKIGRDAVNAIDSPNPQIQTVRLDGNVDIKAAQTDLLRNRRSTENLQLPRIEFNVPQQSFAGFGPGQLLSRRLGNANASPLPNSAPKAATANQKYCLHLTFYGKLEGELRERRVSFFDKIDSLLGPISDWADAVDVNRAETLSANQSRLHCDQLNLFDASELSYNRSPTMDRSTAWEIDALGNAQLNSRTDTGDVTIDASKLGYSAHDDVVRVEGTARRGATIRQYPTQGTNTTPQEIVVSSAAMRLKTGEISGQIRKVEGNLPQNYQLPTGTSPRNPAAPNNQTNPSVLPDPRLINPWQQGNKGR